MRIRVIIVGVVIAALIGSIVTVRAIGRSTAAGDHQAPTQVAPTSVDVVVARRSNLTTTIVANGSVASGREAKLAPKTSGRVASVLVREGHHVAAGAPLLQLDTSDLFAQQAQALANVAIARARLADLLAGARPQEREQASNAVAQAKAQFDLAQADVQRMRTLAEMGAISRQQLDVAETQLRVAQAGYDSARQRQGLVEQGSRTEEIAMARAQLAQAHAVLAGANVRLQDATTTAPFAGTVVQRMIEPGETGSPASPAFILADLNDINVELAVPERNRAGLRIGLSAAVTVDALPGAQFVGRVEEIRPAEALASRSFLVKVHVPNPQELLKPGMFARATIMVAVRENVLQIPEGALVLTSTNPVVFIVRDGKAIRHEVTLGDRQNGMVEITGGLTANDQVVVSGAAGLTDDQPVAPRVSR